MRLIILAFILMGICVAAFIASIFILKEEEKREKKRRERAFMCKKTVREGLCPHCCQKCAWGSYDN